MYNTRKILREEISRSDKSDLKKYILSSKDLEDIITKVVKDKLKGDKDLEKYVLDIAKNSILSFQKALWVKRNMWISSIENRKS